MNRWYRTIRIGLALLFAVVAALCTWGLTGDKTATLAVLIAVLALGVIYAGRHRLSRYYRGRRRRSGW